GRPACVEEGQGRFYHEIHENARKCTKMHEKQAECFCKSPSAWVRGLRSRSHRTQALLSEEGGSR
ncbi:MAG: hypothetical protein FWB93_04555, partial [Oscillospiraceae bacterium]|nr:hypothetical protein [Oscillospiraceae bacterium]